MKTFGDTLEELLNERSPEEIMLNRTYDFHDLTSKIRFKFAADEPVNVLNLVKEFPYTTEKEREFLLEYGSRLYAAYQDYEELVGEYVQEILPFLWKGKLTSSAGMFNLATYLTYELTNSSFASFTVGIISGLVGLVLENNNPRMAHWFSDADKKPTTENVLAVYMEYYTKYLNL
ncbi:MAG: hypothetical protein Q8Q01_05680 [archaeon]|nr:hypothetical protein [archaeon]